MNDLTDPRILFAAERTLLAWIRTGLAIMAFGFALAELKVSLSGGIGLVVLGAIMNLAGALEYTSIVKRLRSGDHSLPTRPVQIATAVAVLLAIAGAAGVVYLLR